MYYVTKTTHVRLPERRSVVLGEGPRGVQVDVTDAEVDFDKALEKALPDAVLKSLIKSGVIEVRE